jgi:hypothetical protein
MLNVVADKMKILPPSMLTLFALAFVAVANAQAPDNFMRVAPGGVILIVPAINGFQLPLGQERAVSTLAEPFVLPKNRLLAVLLTSADLRLFATGGAPKLDDYFILQIPRSVEDRAVRLTEFQPLRRGIRENQEAGQLRVSPTVKRQLAEASKQMSDRSGSRITISITEPIALGVFEDTERSIGVTLLSRVRAEAHDARTEDLMLSSSIVTVVRGKLLYINGACTFNSMVDLSRCNSYAKAWLSALHAANP